MCNLNKESVNTVLSHTGLIETKKTEPKPPEPCLKLYCQKYCHNSICQRDRKKAESGREHHREPNIYRVTDPDMGSCAHPNHFLLSGLLFCWASVFVGLHWAYFWVAADGGSWGTEYVSFTSDINKPECYSLNTTMSMFHTFWREINYNNFLSLSLSLFL